MYSKTTSPIMCSAAWRISLWATLAFAVGAMLVLAMVHSFVADDIQRRSDAWLSGEVKVLGDVAERTPKDRLYSRVVGEVAELASREVPNRQLSSAGDNDAVFFLQASEGEPVKLWVGSGDGVAELVAIRSAHIVPDLPFDINVPGFPTPFRVASVRIADGSDIYLGLSERDELHVLRNLRIRFLAVWFVIVLLGFVIVFYATWKMLGRVSEITGAASRIGRTDLSSRVTDTRGKDEIGHLGRTMNHMLDRIESTVRQLHTITDSLAHDLKSPLTAMRGKLETTLDTDLKPEHAESIVSVIDELDRLTEFLNTSLDVAEARADALRLSLSKVDLEELVRSMVDFYEPSMSDRGLAVQVRSAGSVQVLADPALLHRVVSNLLDNERKHLPASCSIWVSIRTQEQAAELTVEDNGPGFDPDITRHLFERRVKGRASRGHGLGLAFVAAVIRAHGGSMTAGSRPGGGSRLTVSLPLYQELEQGPALREEKNFQNSI
jgi:signal transduction histidine kinase